MLSVHSLTCVRNQQLLFSNLNFSLAPTEILHVTGSNGSGKTSLLQILVGLLKPYQGEIYWKSLLTTSCYADYRASLIYLGHKTGIKPSLTVLENLQFSVKLSEKLTQNPDWYGALERFGLRELSHVLCQNLSAGQRQRVALARLLLTDATLWVLDEPFTSLDVVASAFLKTLLLEHSARGGMLVLTSHQELGFAETLMRKLPL